ncbi:MAG: hypothetical protein C0623_09595 [Desulfuromonas sp.]|nr:MAG: hypothetical protein C0623_09595 [Desulfuromonas sp.]
MTRVATIKFRTAGKHYNFNAREIELKAGDQVIVETDRGRALGSVVVEPTEIDQTSENRELKNVLRIATEEDLQLASTNAEREEDALRYCKSKVIERNMAMKMVKAEYLFDGSKIIFYFTADNRVDFRELVKDLAHHFHTRIEMRQIGVRDEAKLIGGLGICGQALCCCSFLTDFTPVSVKMAKEQQLALNPNKISGQCGRLLCCLSYEYETYRMMRKGMPKNGLKLTADGLNAQVTELDILRQVVSLRIEDGRFLKLSKEQFTELQSTGKLPEQEAPPEIMVRNEPKPKAESKKEIPADDNDDSDRPKRKRRRRRRKPSGGGGNSPDNSGKSGKENKPEHKEKSTPSEETKRQQKNEDKQADNNNSAPSGEQKKRRRRRRRRSGPKPENNDKS